MDRSWHFVLHDNRFGHALGLIVVCADMRLGVIQGDRGQTRAAVVDVVVDFRMGILLAIRGVAIGAPEHRWYTRDVVSLHVLLDKSSIITSPTFPC